jgi:hypothetical protein
MSVLSDKPPAAASAYSTKLQKKGLVLHPFRNAGVVAGVAKLADAPDLGSGAARHVGSTPIARTKAS